MDFDLTEKQKDLQVSSFQGITITNSGQIHEGTKGDSVKET